MLALEKLQKDLLVGGLLPDQFVRIVSVEHLGDDAVTVYYKDAQGQLGERLLFRSDEAQLSAQETETTDKFNASGKHYKLTLEAYRIQQAAQFDPMMAIHTSQVDPLPHQISAVYETLLPKQPLRFVLADDPGAGKTIMAGLLIKELKLRADATRILIVAPGALTEQWQEELDDKLDVQFELFSNDGQSVSRHNNPFANKAQLICRLDQLSRNPQLQKHLQQLEWDLVIFDEAHKLSVKTYPRRLSKTKRFQLGEMLAARTRHLLLITATPMNGKTADFHAWLSLLDPDRFYGPGRQAQEAVDISDVMRRMAKEDLLRFDGTPLFPERRAYTARYQLSPQEAALYDGVTNYVRHEMSRLEAQGEHQKSPVGFALTLLQRRLASSPAAIFHSLRRRRERMEQKLDLLSSGHNLRAPEAFQSFFDAPTDWEDNLSAQEYDSLSQSLLEQASSAHSLVELQHETQSLRLLEEQAFQLLTSGQDKKWEELSRLLVLTPEMYDAEGQRRKLIIFTEHRDTLEDLQQRIVQLLGDAESVITLHGGLSRVQRHTQQEAFRNDPTVRILIATDAAGEGVNLQSANLMVNYDLPWNPNRLEQRFGRIHRIGQTEVCHLWHMVASDTREGRVFDMLFDKLETEREILGGKVFDILGEAFENVSLQDLLIQAIRQDNPIDLQEQLSRQLAQVLDQERLRGLLKRHALVEQAMDFDTLSAIKADMEKAEARKLQPFFVRAYFLEVFKQLGGECREMEPGRYRVSLPNTLFNAQSTPVSDRPLLPRYERICFDKALKQIPGTPKAELVHPEHPLMQHCSAIWMQQHRQTLDMGALLINPEDDSTDLRLLLMLEHSVRSAQGTQILSRRIEFITLDHSGHIERAGWAPHLDLRPVSAAEAEMLTPLCQESELLQTDWSAAALAYAASHLLPNHYRELKSKHEAQVEKVAHAVEQRLGGEIRYWHEQYELLQAQIDEGEASYMQPETALKRLTSIKQRLAERQHELQNSLHLLPSAPRIISSALVAPQGLLMKLREDDGYFISTAAKARVENIAMRAVLNHERQLGHQVVDVSSEKCGWDITACPPALPGQLPPERHIEVKGRAKGQSTLTITRNEILYALNQAEKFWLAIVLVEGEDFEGPYYVHKPFDREPDFGVASVNYQLKDLLGKAATDHRQYEKKIHGFPYP